MQRPWKLFKVMAGSIGFMDCFLRFQNGCFATIKGGNAADTKMQAAGKTGSAKVS